MTPNDALAREAGLTADNGIVVDAFMTTSDPKIFAIGDCAAFDSPFAERRVRLESVQNAVDQAKTVAARIMGTAEPYRSVPWFWSDQGPFKLQIVGLTAGADHVELARIGEEGKLIAYCFKGDTLLGIETVNRPGEHMLGRRILGQDLKIAKADVAHHAFELKAHVAKLMAEAGLKPFPPLGARQARRAPSAERGLLSKRPGVPGRGGTILLTGEFAKPVRRSPNFHAAAIPDPLRPRSRRPSSRRG